MERRIYQPTEKDAKKAIEKASMREQELRMIEEHRSDTGYWRKRHTTYGLAKRNVCRLMNAGDIEFYEGRGQGLIDQMMALPYSNERRSAAYNQGYHTGYTASLGEMVDYISNNPNFDGIRR